MGKWSKVLDAILRGESDASIPFDDLCGLLLRLGFEMRVRGSHHVFRKPGVIERPNLQKDGHNAKSYQVRQVRAMIIHYKLMGDV